MSQAIWWLNRGQFDYVTAMLVEDFKAPAQVLAVLSVVGCDYIRTWHETNTGDVYRWSDKQPCDGPITVPTRNDASPFKRYLRWSCIGLLLDIRDAEQMQDWPGNFTDLRLRKLDRTEIRELARTKQYAQSHGATGHPGSPRP